jgi:hypothetical protein
MVLGCASETADPPSDGDRVFGVTPTATPNGGEILGVWESVAPQKQPPLSATTRFELRVDSITMAMHCTMDDGTAQPINVGAKAEATVSKDGITVKSSIERIERIGANGACGVKFGAGVLPTCDANTAVEKRGTCFAFEPGSLKIYQQAGAAPIDLKKVAD